MGFELKNRIALSIFVDDTELPIDSFCLVTHVDLGATLVGSLPTMSLGLFDSAYVLDGLALARDATRIRIVIGTPDGNSKTYPFRLFDAKRISTAAGSQWDIDGYYDYPVYWSGTSSATYIGSTNDVLQEIASLCSMPYQGSATSDRTTWAQSGKSYKQFAKHLARSGLAGDASRMCLSVGLNGIMRYMDANAPPEYEYTLTNKQIVEGQIPMSSYMPSSVSGYGNRSSGYASRLYVQSLGGGSMVETLDFTPNVTTPQVNMEVRSLVRETQPRFSYIDVGNSAQTERARYQNERYGVLFNQEVTMLSNFIMMPFDISDWINCAFVYDNGDTDKANSGLYMVKGRAISIRNSNYVEKILGVRHGINQD